MFADCDHVSCQTSDSTDVTMEDDVTESDDDVRVLARVDASRQVSLQAEAEVDPMEGEQTWPTPDELAEADGETEPMIFLMFSFLVKLKELCVMFSAEAHEMKVKRKVPVGTSEYQAAWIVESDHDDVSEDEDDDNMQVSASPLFIRYFELLNRTWLWLLF